MSCGVNSVSSSADSLYPYAPNVKLEYPSCMQSSHYMGGMPSSIPSSMNGVYPSTSIPSTVTSTASTKQVRHCSAKYNVLLSLV